MALFIKQSPFFRLFLYTILGIVTAQYFEIDLFWLCAITILLWCALAYLFFLIKNIRIDFVWGIVFNILCFVVGFILAENAKPYTNIPDFNGNNRFTVIVEKYEGKINNNFRYIGRLYLADSLKFIDKTVKIRLQTDTTNPVLKEGEIVFCKGSLKKIENRGTPGEFDYKTWANRKQIYYNSFVSKGNCTSIGYNEPLIVKQWLDRIRVWIEQCFTKFGIKGDQNAVLIALTTGDKASLDPELKSAFTTAGLMHVLAVSGLHVGIIYLVLSWLTKPLLFVRYGKSFRILITIAILWIYAFFTGMAPSVERAVLMFSFLVIGEASGRKYSGLNSLFASAFFLMIFNPNIIYEIGFQLSYLAVFGIFQFYKPVYDLVYFKNKLFDKIWSLCSLSVAAQLATTPISLYYFSQFPAYFLLGNLVIVPLVGFIIQGAIAFMALSFYEPLAKIVAWCVNIMLEFMTRFTEWVAMLPYSLITNIYVDIVEISGVYVLFILAFYYFKHHNHKMLISLSTLLCLLLIYSAIKTQHQNQVKDIHVFNSTGNPVYIVESRNIHSIVFDSTTPIQRHIAQLSKFYGLNLKHVSHIEHNNNISVWKHPVGKILIAPENLLQRIDTTLLKDFDVIVKKRAVWNFKH